MSLSCWQGWHGGVEAIKRYTTQHGEIQCALAEEKKLTNEAKEKLGMSQRKAGALAGELEESKQLLEAALRGQKQVQAELQDVTDQAGECTMANNTAVSAKRKMSKGKEENEEMKVAN